MSLLSTALQEEAELPTQLHQLAEASNPISGLCPALDWTGPVAEAVDRLRCIDQAHHSCSRVVHCTSATKGSLLVSGETQTHLPADAAPSESRAAAAALQLRPGAPGAAPRCVTGRPAGQQELRLRHPIPINSSSARSYPNLYACWYSNVSLTEVSGMNEA